MDPQASQESLGLTATTATCPYENKVISDPTTARIVLMFLRDFVEQKMVYAQNPQGFYCPMTKCNSSFSEPLLLIQHLLSCPELGKGEFECWKCCSWHRFPVNEKEWPEWSGWKSTTPGFQRKRSLGSKMKETLTETLALRRRNSGRKISISSTPSVTDSSHIPAAMMASAATMVTSPTHQGTTVSASPDINEAVSSSQQPAQYRPPTDFSAWNQLLGMASAQILSPQAVQELRTAFILNQEMAPAFSQTTSNEAKMGTGPITTAAPSYACTFDDTCYVTSQHYHHRLDASRDVSIKPEEGLRAPNLAEACSCGHFDGSSATSITLDDASASMMWSTDVDSSDISNISSTRPSKAFDQSSSIPSSTDPSQGSFFANQDLAEFSREAAHLIAAGMTSGTASRLPSDISTLRSPAMATSGILLDARGGASSTFSPASTMKSDDRLTVTGSFASTPASMDLERIDKAAEERHNWYHGQNMNDSVILAPVSANDELVHFSHGEMAPAASMPITTTAANSNQHTSTRMDGISSTGHSLATHATLGGLPPGSMDIDMGHDTHQAQPRPAVLQNPALAFLQTQSQVSQGQELLSVQIQQQEQPRLAQQQIPSTLQEPASQVNHGGGHHDGLYTATTNMTAAIAVPKYEFSGDDHPQPVSRPTSHHQHGDLTSSSRTSLQPPKTPASTIDDDIDPEDLVCPQCQWKPRGVRENLRGYLRKHKNVHKGLRLSCDIPGCKKSFSRLDNLKTHRRDKHSIDDTAPASKAASIVSVDSASIMTGRQLTAAGSNTLSVKRAMAMNDYNNEGIIDMMSISSIPTTIAATQSQHVLQAAANIAHAQAQAQAQLLQAQLQARAQAQAEEQVQDQAQAQFVQAQIQAQAAQEQAQQVQPEPLRPGSKRQRESLDHGYRGVSGEHAALWPLMQI